MGRPSLGTRLYATVIRREVPSGDLEALRGAGSGVYDALLAVEKRRTDELIPAGADAWTLAAHMKAQFLAYWCAFANQKLGEAFLDADYEYDPRTRGYVPPVTAEQVQAFFTEVEHWLERLSRAEVNTSYRIDVPLPALLPHWVEVEPCPRAHLMAMLAACGTLVEHAEMAVNDLRSLGADKHGKEFEYLEGELAAAKSAGDYATRLHAQIAGAEAVSEELHERIERSIKQAIDTAYRLGQLAAMPELIEIPGARGARADQGEFIRRLPGPGEDGFDMWCLTDPASRREWRRDRAAERAVEMLWKYDPDPAATLAVQAEIDAAEARRDIRRNGLGCYFCCPWSAIYQAIDPVTIGGKRIRRGQTFTFDVSAEDMAEGGDFKREVLVAQFSPTGRTDYCNPEEGHHDD